jgi:hypothetical protein
MDQEFVKELVATLGNLTENRKRAVVFTSNAREKRLVEELWLAGIPAFNLTSPSDHTIGEFHRLQGAVLVADYYDPNYWKVEADAVIFARVRVSSVGTLYPLHLARR